MADLNEVRLIGRLTRDPETKSVASGQALTTLGIATSRKYKSGEEWREETTFVDVTCWGKLAEICATNLRKGRQVFIGGRLRLESWDDKQSGQKRNKLSVVADNVQFLDRRDDAAQAQQANFDRPMDDEPPF